MRQSTQCRQEIAKPFGFPVKTGEVIVMNVDIDFRLLDYECKRGQPYRVVLIMRVSSSCLAQLVPQIW